MGDLYELIRRKYHLRTREEAKAFAFPILYGGSKEAQDELLQLANDHSAEQHYRDHGGEGG